MPKTWPELRRLVPAVLIFAVIAVAASHQDDLLRRFSSQAIAQAGQYFSYGLQIAIWLSAAYLLNRLIQVFVWDEMVKRALGTTPPRLLSDVCGAVVYLMAITGIVGFVFNQPITGFWASSGVVGLVIGLALRNVILDVFIGLAVNIDRPYHIGDVIMLQSG